MSSSEHNPGLRHIAKKRWLMTKYGSQIANFLNGDSNLTKLFRAATTLEQVTSLAVGLAYESDQEWQAKEPIDNEAVLDLLSIVFPRLVVKSTEKQLNQPEHLLCQMTYLLASKEYEPALPESYQETTKALLTLHKKWQDFVYKQRCGSRNMFGK